MKKKILVAFDHDIPIRHFLLNKTFGLLEEECDVVYLFGENPKRIATDLNKLPTSNRRIVFPIDQNRVGLFRKFYRVSVKYNSRTNSAYKSTGGLWISLLKESKSYREIARIYILASRLIFPFYKRHFLKKIGENERLKELIRNEKPDLIVHPTVLEGSFVSDLISIGDKLGIPTLYLMNSWDNPSTKALMVGQPTVLAVWGPQTYLHAQSFLKIEQNRLIKLGSAQFEVYKKQPAVSREEFLKRMGMESSKKVILYAGSSQSLDEIEQLQTLEEAINSGALPHSQVLYRPHPWRGSRLKEKNFFNFKWEHVTLDPYAVDFYKESYRESYNGHPIITDYEETNIVLSSSDIIITGISTMMLEAALLGKPVICSVYDSHKVRSDILDKISKMVHFRDFFDNIPSYESPNAEKFVLNVKDALLKSDDANFKKSIIEATSYMIEPAGGSYSQRLVNLVKDLIQT